jgi:hypothetical protein
MSSMRLNPNKDGEACRKNYTIDSTMLAFASPRHRRNCMYCTDKGQGLVIAETGWRRRRLSRREKEKEHVPRPAGPNWCPAGADEAKDIRLGLARRKRVRDTCKDEFPQRCAKNEASMTLLCSLAGNMEMQEWKECMYVDMYQ